MEELSCGAVSRRIVGSLVGPAAPEDADPGAGKRPFALDRCFRMIATLPAVPWLLMPSEHIPRLSRLFHRNGSSQYCRAASKSPGVMLRIGS